MSAEQAKMTEAGADDPVKADGPAASAAWGPYRASHPVLKWLERALERGLGLEHGANIFPLIHVLCYYVFLSLVVSHLVTSPWLLAPLWVLLVLLNYSLSIGILHLHAHRKLFVKRWPNRVLEALLAVPCGNSYPVMLYCHVYLHHRYEDGEKDPTSTKGYERGLRAMLYWVRFPYIAHKVTLLALFSKNSPPAWRRFRFQYALDSCYVLAIAVAYGIYDLNGMLLFYLLPMLVTLLNIGFFAWLTHAPAQHGPINGSINTTNNLMNLFVHNQGYHAVHHRYPRVHWTRLPDRLEMMKSVDDDLIVPYWVTLDNAVRIVHPGSFRASRHGKAWKERYVKRVATGAHRLSWLPYFGWI